MKRFFLTCILSLPLILLADEPIGDVHHLESCLQVDDIWVLVLDDASCWELSPMKPKEQSWSEWWNGVQPTQPDERFLVDLTTWKHGGSIEVLAPAHTSLAGYPYLLHHTATGGLVHARLLPPDAIYVPKTCVARTFQQMGNSKTCVVRSSLDLQGMRYLILDDDSIWEMRRVRENTRSISQWWSGVELEQPDTPFLFSSYSWTESTSLILSAYNWGSLGFDQLYHSPLQGCSYLFENPETHEMAYATPVTAHELARRLIRYGEERYSAGHAAGYSSGYSAGRAAGVNAANKKPMPPEACISTRVVPSVGSAGRKDLSLKEERIALAMGDNCKLRGWGPPPSGRCYPREHVRPNSCALVIDNPTR